MSLHKNVSGIQLSSPFLDFDVEPGDEVDLPDAQSDGTPLIWASEYWQKVKPPAKADSKVDTKVKE